MKSLLFLVAAVPAVLVATGANAQNACAPRASIITQLATAYDEHPVAIGVTEDGRNVLEWFASHDGSWTLIRTDPQRLSCVVATGLSFASAIEPKGISH
jgi:hypothetical protein